MTAATGALCPAVRSGLLCSAAPRAKPQRPLVWELAGARRRDKRLTAILECGGVRVCVAANGQSAGSTALLRCDYSTVQRRGAGVVLQGSSVCPLMDCPMAVASSANLTVRLQMLPIAGLSAPSS